LRRKEVYDKMIDLFISRRDHFEEKYTQKMQKIEGLLTARK